MRLIDADALCERCKEAKCDYMGCKEPENCAAAEMPTIELTVTGETSDGYHTFNELYHHRAVLFSVIVKAFPDKAWKSRLHSDGSMFNGMFIVGIDTPEGPATYHYYMDPYWDMFACNEIDRAPEWDGHTPAQAIERIGKLEPEPVVRCKDCVRAVPLGEDVKRYYHDGCMRCTELNDGYLIVRSDDYCSAGMRKEYRLLEYADNDTAQYADNPTV